MGRGVSLASAGLAGRASICGRVIAAPIQGRMPRECAGQGRATRFGAYSSHGGSLLAHRAAEVSVAGGRAKRPVRRRAARCVYGRLAGRRGSATIRHMGPFAVGRTCRTGAYRESMTIDAPIAECLRPHRRPGRTSSACRFACSVCPRMERRISRSISWIPLASVEYKKKSTAIRDYGEPCGGEAGI